MKKTPHVTFTLRIPVEMRDQAEAAAQGHFMSLNSWVLACMRAELAAPTERLTARHLDLLWNIQKRKES